MKLALFSILLFFLYSCNSNEITESKDVKQEKIFQYYSVNYKQGEERVEILAQFRFGGITGSTLILNKPANVKFDDKEIVVDSSTALGAFYRIFEPVSSFYGSHAFEYTDMDKKVFKNEFAFEKFIINTSDSAYINKPLILNIQLTPLTGDDRIEITAIDTDSTFKVIHTSKDSTTSILIPEHEIRRQKNKSVTLEAVLYRNIQPAQTKEDVEGGQLEIRYVLKPFRLKIRN